MTKRAFVYKEIEKYYRDNFDNLVTRYTRYVRHYARAEDIVQEAFLRALSYWERFPANPSDYNRWFATLLNNCMKDNRKQEAMHGAVIRHETELTTKPAAIPAIIFKNVCALIETKDDPLRTLLGLALIKQEDTGDIARQVGISKNAVRLHVFRFRQEIKEKYRWKI